MIQKLFNNLREYPANINFNIDQVSTTCCFEGRLTTLAPQQSAYLMQECLGQGMQLDTEKYRGHDDVGPKEADLDTLIQRQAERIQGMSMTKSARHVPLKGRNKK